MANELQVIGQCEAESRRAMGRDCGTCEVCCFVAAVPDMCKPAFTACISANCSGAGGGCRQYEIRPQPCRDYECAWLSGDLPKALRPDVCGVLCETAYIIDAGRKLRLVMGSVDVRCKSDHDQVVNDFAEACRGKLPSGVVVIVVGGQTLAYIARDESDMESAVRFMKKVTADGSVQVRYADGVERSVEV